MNQSNQSKQVLLSVIGVAILVVAVVGVSFAFFNYTRTGTANTVSTGQIKFVSEQTGAINLTNVFPITSTQAQTDTTNAASVTVTIKGDTTYVNGLDYRVTAQDVDFTSGTGTGAVTLPVRVEVTAENLGTAVDTVSGNEADQIKVTSYTSSTPLATGNVLAEGHIMTRTAAQYTGQSVNGTLTIKAYLDADKIAITDTSTRSGDPSVAPTDGSVNGTTNENWIHDRTVITTDQWNALKDEPLSFKVRVESKESVTGSYIN